ncbi:MAG TPA: hypothetical protein VFG20_16635 [Planctomycetaceae bacterium]|nr:hypothetical protein [Planctomycetaceae bacterium]
MDDSPTASEPPPLRPSDRRLQWLLRGIGVLDLLSFAAVVMPRSLMVAIHGSLNIGELSSEPIVGYLARTASMFYGFTGVLLLFLSADVVRFRDVIRFVATCGIVAGIIVLGVDLAEGMPLWWTILEGPCCGLLAATVWWLAR